MAIRQVTLGEALDKGYKILGPTYAEPIAPEPGTFELGASIALEVVPAILGGIWGSYPGAAAGGALGNSLSQWYRNEKNMQEGFSGGELAAATAFSVIPGGTLKHMTGPAKTVTRALQGSAIATGELTARVGLERGELPTQDELRATMLFGGAFGGVLGGIEAKFFSDNFGIPVKAGSTRPETLLQLENKLGDVAGYLEHAPPTAQLLLENNLPNIGAKHPDLAQILREGGGWAEVKRAMEGMPSKDVAKIILESGEATVAKEVGNVVSGASRKSVDEMNDLERMIHGGALQEVDPLTAGFRDYTKLKSLSRQQRSQVEQADIRLPKIEKELHLADEPKVVAKLKKEKAKVEKERDAALDDVDKLPPKLAKAVEKAKPKPKRAKAPVEEAGEVVRKPEPKNWARARKRAEKEGFSLTGKGSKTRETNWVGFNRSGEGFTIVKVKDGFTVESIDDPSKSWHVRTMKEAKESIKAEAPPAPKKAPARAADTFGVHMTQKAARLMSRGLGDSPAALSLEKKLLAVPKNGKKVLLVEDEMDLSRNAAMESQGDAFHQGGGKLKQKLEDIEFAIQDIQKEHGLGLWRKTPRAAAKAPVRAADETNPIVIKAARELEEIEVMRERAFGIGEFHGKGKDPKFAKEQVEGLVEDPADGDWVAAFDNYLQEGPEQNIVSEAAKVLGISSDKANKRISSAMHSSATPSPSRLKQTAVPSLLLAGGGVAVMTDDEWDDLTSTASTAEMIFWLAAMFYGGKTVARLLRNSKVKYLKNNPKARREATRKMPRRNNGDDRGEEIMADAIDPSAALRDKKFWDIVIGEFKGHLGKALEPMSRTLKQITPLLTRAFRDHDRQISKNTKLYMDEMEPFVVGMTRAMKGMVPGKIKNKTDWNAFRVALRNGDMPTLQKLMQKYNGDVLAYNRKKYKRNDIRHNEGAVASYNRMNSALKKIRKYAIDRGGLPVGKIDDYFPSGLKDYQHFKSEMIAMRGWKEKEFNRIDEAINTYKEKWKTTPSPEEEAEIASRILGQFDKSNRGMSPGHAKSRVLESVDEGMINQYHDPADVIRGYVSKMVTATERRRFLGMEDDLTRINKLRRDARRLEEAQAELQKAREAADVSGSEKWRKKAEGLEAKVRKAQEAQQEIDNFTDLGLRADFEGAIGDYLIKAQKEGGFKLTNEEIGKVTEIINARFSAKGHGQLIGAFKDITYMSLLGNFGAAITQLGDLAYSIHFNGLGNTFRAIFDKNAKDWYVHMGLDSSDIDLASSRGGLSKVLNGLLKATQFNRLDKFGKNIVMKSTFIRMSREAKSNPNKLITELEPIYGKQLANKIRNDFATGEFTDDVESVIWYKFLDLQPAALSEMPLDYAIGGKRRLMYTLKTFTIKQWDVFREAEAGKIGRAKELWSKGDKDGAVKLGAEGVAGVVSLAAVFAAMNAGTSIIKDTMYGRPTNYDELSVDMFWRLVGANRYLSSQMRREGIGSAAIEFFMPATTAIDRAYKDLESLVHGDAPVEVYRGIGVGDFYYWHHGGGREKVRKDLAKKYGVKLEYVPK